MANGTYFKNTLVCILIWCKRSTGTRCQCTTSDSQSGRVSTDNKVPAEIALALPGPVHALQDHFDGLVVCLGIVIYVRGTRPIRKNSSLGRIEIRLAIRFDKLKNAVIAPISQISSSSNPCACSNA